MLLLLPLASSAAELLQGLWRQYAAHAPIYGGRAVCGHMLYNIAARLALGLSNLAQACPPLLGWLDGGMRWHTGL